MTYRYHQAKRVIHGEIERRINRLNLNENINDDTLSHILAKSPHTLRFYALKEGLSKREQAILINYLLATMYGAWWLRLFSENADTVQVRKYYDLELKYNQLVIEGSK